MVKGLQDQAKQHKQDKEELYVKISTISKICVDVTAKKHKALDELNTAHKEASQFREDVSFLTGETSQLLDELQSEQEARKKAEAKLKTIECDFDNYRKNNTVQIEDIQRQVELARFNSVKMGEEVAQWKAFAEELKAEK